MFIIKNNGINIINFIFLVLCLNVIIPVKPPRLPPIRLINSNVNSGILYNFFIVFYLNIDYNILWFI